MLPLSNANIPETSQLQFISLLPMRLLLLVAKPVSWTLDPDRPRKTGSRYNDTLSCFGKPKGSVTMSQRITVLFHCLLGDFWLKLHWGGGVFLPPPSPGEGLTMVLFGRAALRIEYNVSMRYVVFQGAGDERDSKMGDKDVEQAPMTDQQPSVQEEQYVDVFEASAGVSGGRPEEKRNAVKRKHVKEDRLLVLIARTRRLRQGQSLGGGGGIPATGSGHRCHKCFLCFFIKVYKTFFYVFCYFLMFFLCFLNVVFLLLLKQKRTKLQI